MLLKDMAQFDLDCLVLNAPKGQQNTDLERLQNKKREIEVTAI